MICIVIVIVNWLDGSGNGKLFGATLSISREFATFSFLNFDLVVLNFMWPLKYTEKWRNYCTENTLHENTENTLLFLRFFT